MNMSLFFLRKPAPLHEARPLRAYAATREENVAAARKKAETTEALRQFVNEQASERAYEAMRIALGVSEP